MTRGRLVWWTMLAMFTVTAVAFAFIMLPKWYAEAGDTPVATDAQGPPATPKIRAQLFYLSDDGLRLVALEREVAVGEGTVQQARQLIEAQLETPPKPLLSPIPEGTKLRALYVSAQGDAFVDLSNEVSTGHPGGALEEILTVYAIVDVVTVNLPAVRAVQILVNGHEVDTLAGHVDLRQPLAKNPVWIQDAAAPASAPAPVPAPAVAEPVTK
jgi:hypothetical protein